jgi:hypothetical protein
MTIDIPMILILIVVDTVYDIPMTIDPHDY